MKVSILGVDYCSNCGWVSQQGPVPDDESLIRARRSRRKNQRGESSNQRHRKVVALIARDGDLCHYCGLRLDAATRTVDEKQPRSKGGLCVIDNQVLACRTCNTDKADMPYDEYLAVIAEQGTRWERKVAAMTAGSGYL